MKRTNTSNYSAIWRTSRILLLLLALLAQTGAVSAQPGITWTSQTPAADNGWLYVTYGNGLFVAVSATGSGNRVMTSPDGVTWTSRTSAADNNWRSVTYGNGLFVAVAISGTGNRVMTSPDGITWTSRTPPTDNNWFSVTYGNGLFVAVAYSGSGNRVMTSPDGITWTSRTSAADIDWYAVTYGNGLFVAVSGSGSGNRVMTSPDGITWTSRTSASNNNWHSVTYGNGLFVAVSYTGAGNRVMTSPDGITWTSRTSAANNEWYSVIYGNGLFVAVSGSGSGNRVMTSPDGITWTSRTSATDNLWRSVVYGNGMFVAVAYTGSGNHVMTSGSLTNTWTGTTSTDWNTASNWSSSAVPTGTDNISIPSAPSNQPHVTLAPASPAECANLTVESEATLTVDEGKALTVSGATANEGTILVKADATGIGSLITQGTVTGSGSCKMEQYLTGSNNAGTPNGVFYYVGSPVVGATAASYDIASGNKLWSADESTQSYSQITVGTTELNAGEGYVARMGTTDVFTHIGTSFNTGNQSITGLDRTGTDAANRGYNLVSNPYPSSLNWNNVDTTNLFGTVWYRTHNASNVMTYDTYNAVAGTGTSNNYRGTAATGIIPPTQGFWVRVKNDESTASLNFTNAMRSHGTLSGIYKTTAESGTLRMTLSDGTTSDEAILLFNENADDDFDAYDSQKMWASHIPQLYMNKAEDTLVINGLYSTATNPIVDLGVKLPSSGNYTLNANEITVVGETVHLEDRMLNIFQDLNTEPNYSFTSTSGNIGDRFALHFGMSVTGIGTDAMQGVSTRVYTSNGNTLNIILSDNTENGKVDVMDMAGRIVGSFNLNATQTSLPINVTTGVYLVRIQTENGTDTHRIFIK